MTDAAVVESAPPFQALLRRRVNPLDREYLALNHRR